jgi:hypothetical protein
MNSNKGQVATTIASVLLSFLASSHHLLHMAVLLILGGSTNMMATMSGFLWLRRIMIAATLLTVAYPVYILVTHWHIKKPLLLMSLVSSVVSIAFVCYSLWEFGW